MNRLQALKTGDVWDFIANDSPKCPHCGESHSISENDWQQLYEEGLRDVTCPACSLDFFVKTEVSYSFSTNEHSR